MKFQKEITTNGTVIPHSALELSGFAVGQEAELHTAKGAVALIRKQMTAAELVETIDSLTNLVTGLVEHLVRCCGHCEACGDEGCPYGDDCYLEIPEYLRREAGIPEDAKLCATTDREAGTVTISQVEYFHDLRDVPSGLLTVLQENGICLGELEERLMVGDIIYG